VRSGPETEEAQRQSLEEACVPFDIERAPLMRARLFKLEAAEYLLVTTVHHLAFDGWSLDPIHARTVRHLRCGNCREVFTLSQPALQYADWSVWQRRRMETEYVAPLLDYWREQLRNTVAPKCLSFDRPRMRGTAPQIGRHAFAVSKELTEEIRHLAAGSGVTAFVLMLAAFQTLLYRRNGHEDIVVGSPIANRNRMELTEMIGCFVNLLALRVHIGDRPPFAACSNECTGSCWKLTNIRICRLSC
jgi:hypothetical protein